MERPTLFHMIAYVSRGLVILAFAAFGTFVGGFVFHEMGQGHTVPTVAGVLFGAVFGLGLAGVRGRLFDTLFPPGDRTEDR